MRKQQHVMEVAYSAMLWTNNECLEHNYIGTNGEENHGVQCHHYRHLYFSLRHKPENCVVLLIPFSYIS